MRRKSVRMSLALGAVILVAALAACSGEVVRSVYTAAGDGSTPKDLVKTSTFRGDDDLNVVVRLGSHSRDLTVSAVFSGPAGEVYSTDALEADNTVVEVVLGLDWEAQGATFWTPGEWRVDIYVDEALEKTAHFTVQQTALSPEG
ncbi:MAG: hypothetical protein ACUVSU_13125 [Aggregatilineaceae bacterium]